MKKKWYNISSIGSNVAQISIYDEVGQYNNTVADFALEFNQIKNSEQIELYINSPGGSLDDGLAMYNLLSTVKDKLTTINVGLCASIASIIYLAGSNRITYKNSLFMVHNPLMNSYGNSKELRKDADTLDKVAEQLVAIYKTNSNLDDETIRKMLDDETWIDSSQAFEYGLATEVVDLKAVACMFSDLKDKYSKVPKALIRSTINTKDITIRDLEETLRDVGFSINDAKILASAGFSKLDSRESKKASDIDIKELKNMLLDIVS